MSESNYGKRKISDMHDWYFDGYEPVEYVDDKGRKRTKLVYDGTWYSFGLDEAGLRRMRRTFLFIMIPYVLINVLGLLHMCSLASVLPGGFFAINLVPVFYFCVGLVQLLRLPEVFNNRQRCRSMRRMEAGVWCMIAIIGLDLLICVIDLFKPVHKLSFGNILFVLMSVVLMLANIWLRRLVDRYRYKVVSDKRSRKKEKEFEERMAAAKAAGKPLPTPAKEKKAPLPGAIDAIIEVEDEEEFEDEPEEDLGDEE